MISVKLGRRCSSVPISDYQTTGVLPSGRNDHRLASLDGKRDFPRQMSDRVDEKLTDRLVQALTQDMLAYRHHVVGSVELADTLRHDLGLPRRVTNRHPAATDPTDSPAL